MNCDVCGKTLEPVGHYVVTLSNTATGVAHTCRRVACARKAFAIAESRCVDEMHERWMRYVRGNEPREPVEV